MKNTERLFALSNNEICNSTFVNRCLLLAIFIIGFVTTGFAETVITGTGSNSINLISSTDNETILQFNINSFDKTKTDIGGESWFQISLPKEGVLQDKGFPELPVFNRSIIIDNNALMHLQIYDIQYQDFQMAIAPSKGAISRNINPETIPYTFGKVYQSKEFYPSQVAALSEPYILRDFRGITIKTVPFAYNAETKTLRVYTSYKIRVYADGIDTINTLSISRASMTGAFTSIYENHFLNWGNVRYTPVSDVYGKLLVICYDSYLTQIAPYVNWKKQKGINAELVAWSTVGTTAANLKSYIQTRYTADNTIAYVQIVGDAPQIPTISYTYSSLTGGSDPSFSLVAGTDSYPDIFIGRFSASTTTEVTTQVNRTITYEKDLTTSATWLSQAMGLASAEGGSGNGDNGEADITHMNLIRTKLLNYGYSSVDQVYDPGALASTVTTNVNAGRGFINYCGHGSDTTWGTTGFSTTNATALNNGNKTPFIMDVACVNGNFVSITCFAEAWLRNANGGAVGIYASSINQDWNPPMNAEDEVTNILTAESKNTLGGLYYNGSCKMIDVYTTAGIGMFMTWNIFGDASLLVRTKTPVAMSVTHPSTLVAGTTTVNVTTGVANALVAITYSNTIYARGFANSSGIAALTLTGAPAGAVTYTITATAFNRVTYVGTISQTVSVGPFMEVTAATYADSNNNTPDYNESGRFNVTFRNSGTSIATNVTATLTCGTTGIALTDVTETITSLAAGASSTINNAYAYSITNNVADGLSAAFTITMVSGANTWTYSFNQTINAPLLALGSITISDPSPGNNNGRLDPGETVTITMPLSNTGHAATLAGSGTLTSPTTGITINTGTANFTAISASGNTNLSYNITAASSMAVGSLASLVFNATAGAYAAGKTESVTIGAPTIITIGTGTSTQTYPMDRYYNYSGFESIYLVSEVGAAGTIKTLGFNKSSGTDINPITSVAIYLKNTTSTTLATGAYSTTGYTLVYSGSFPNTATTGWMQVTLDTEFIYNGTSNLGILIIKGNQSYLDTGYPYWYYTTSTTSRTRMARSDDNQPASLTTSTNLPNIKLGIYLAPTVLNPPQNLISSSGNAVVNLSWSAPVSGTPANYKIYRNSVLLTTATGLTYNDTAVSNGFTYSYYVTAVYTTPTAGESVATSTVSATPNIYPPQTLTSIAGDATVTLNWLAPVSGTPTGYKIYKNTILLTSVTALTYTDNAVVNGTLYSYYVTAAYSSPAGESTVSNTINVTPVGVITSPYLINENIQSWTAHASYGSYTQSIPAGIVSMTQCIVTPAAAGSGTGTLGLVQLQASAGILTLPILPTCGTAEFHMNAGGTNRTIKLQKYNGATWDDLTTFTINLVGTTFTYDVNSSSSTTLRLSSPSNSIYVHDILVSNYAVAPTTPIFSLDSSSMSYGDVPVGTAAIDDFTITNNGTGTLSGLITPPTGFSVSEARNDIELSGLESGTIRDFTAYSIIANQSKTYILTFAPLAVQTYNGNLTITSNDTNHLSNTINLTGAGYVPPTISVSDTSYNPSVFFNETATRTLQLNNSGSQMLNYSIQLSEPSREAIASLNASRNVNWISLSAASGSVGAGQTQDITVSFISPNTQPGTHPATITINSNDPINPARTISIEFEVKLATPITCTNCSTGSPVITWPVVPGANAYKIYTSNLPNSGFVYQETTTNLFLNCVVDSSRKYYRIVSVFE